MPSFKDLNSILNTFCYPSCRFHEITNPFHIPKTLKLLILKYQNILSYCFSQLAYHLPNIQLGNIQRCKTKFFWEKLWHWRGTLGIAFLSEQLIQNNGFPLNILNLKGNADCRHSGFVAILMVFSEWCLNSNFKNFTHFWFLLVFQI